MIVRLHYLISVTFFIVMGKRRYWMLKIGLCDDEKRCIDILVEYLDRLKTDIKEEFEYSFFEKGEEVLEYTGELDILFLDIQMDGISGIETMRSIEKNNKIKNIVFVSSYSERMNELFGLKTRAFIYKPIEYLDFSKEMIRVINNIVKVSLIEIHEKTKNTYVDSRDIMYVIGEDKYIKIVTTKTEYIVCSSLREWENKLAEYNMIRVHKSYIVNMNYISKFADKINLSNNIEIPIGRKYKDIARQQYKDFLFSKFREDVDE